MENISLKKNYIYKLSYELLAILCPLITSPYVARVLGADGVGIASYTSSILTFFTMAASLGTASYGMKEIAQHRDDKYQASKLFYEIELLTATTSLLSLLCWGILIISSYEYSYYFLALTPQIVATMVDISWFYNGYEKVSYTVVRNAAVRIIGVLLLFIFVKQKEDLFIFLLLNTSICLLGNLSMWLYLPKMLTKVRLRDLSVRPHYRQTLAFFIPTIAASISAAIDKALIGTITGDAFQNGYYEQATKIINICQAVSFSAVNGVMGARLSFLFSEKRFDEIRYRINRSIDFILLISIGCFFGIIGIADRFVPFFFGQGYSEVVIILRLMAPIVIILGISRGIEEHYYSPSGNRALSARYVVYGAILNVIITIILLPGLGARGATIGSVIAESFIMILLILHCNSYISFSYIISVSWKRVLAGSLMFIAISAIGRIESLSNATTVFLEFSSGITLYGLVLILLRDSMLLQCINMFKVNILKK